MYHCFHYCIYHHALDISLCATMLHNDSNIPSSWFMMMGYLNHCARIMIIRHIMLWYISSCISRYIILYYTVITVFVYSVLHYITLRNIGSRPLTDVALIFVVSVGLSVCAEFFSALWPWPLTFWLWSVVIHGGSRGQPLHEVWRCYGYPFLRYEFWHLP